MAITPKSLLEVPSEFPYTNSMKNKNNETIEQYEANVGAIYKALNDLKTLMATKEFKKAYKWDQEENDGEANMNGEFSCFVQDLAEGWARE